MVQYFPNLTDIQTLAPKALGGKGVLGEAYKLTAVRVLKELYLKKKQDNLQRYQRVGVVGSSG